MAMDQQDSGKTAAALEVIEAFGGIRPMAQKLGVAASTVQGWKERLAIPEARHAAISKIVAAESINLDLEVLAASAHPPEALPEEAAPVTEIADSGGTASVAWTGADEEAAAIAESEAADTNAETVETEAAAIGGGARQDGASLEGTSQGGFSKAAFGLGALVVLVAVGITVLARDLWLPPSDGAANNTQSLDRFEARISKLESAPTQTARIAKLEAEVGTALAAAEAAQDEARRALAESSGGVNESNLQTLDARLTERLQTGLSKVTARLDRIESHQVIRPVSTDDLILTLSLGRLREAILLGDGFQSLLERARSAAAGRPAVALELAGLAPYADTGVPRIVALQQSFEDAAQSIVAAAAGEGETDGLLAGIKRRLARVVTVRPLSGEASGDGTAARVARAENSLETGDLSGAVSQIEGLEGLAAEAAQEWLDQANRRLEAEKRLAAATEVFLAELSSAASTN